MYITNIAFVKCTITILYWEKVRWFPACECLFPEDIQDRIVCCFTDDKGLTSGRAGGWCCVCEEWGVLYHARRGGGDGRGRKHILITKIKKSLRRALKGSHDVRRRQYVNTLCAGIYIPRGHKHRHDILLTLSYSTLHTYIYIKCVCVYVYLLLDV